MKNPSAQGNHQSLTDDAARIAALREHGIKATRPRIRILAALDAADTPLSVPEIQARLEEDSGWISTLYRTLDLFTQKGLVVRSTPMGDGLNYYQRNRHQHTHYAVCLSCRRMIDLQHCPIQDLVPELGESGFTVIGHHLEITGYCSDCAKDAEPSL